jgi:hypothetical protein
MSLDTASMPRFFPGGGWEYEQNSLAAANFRRSARGFSVNVGYVPLDLRFRFSHALFQGL